MFKIHARLPESVERFENWSRASIDVAYRTTVSTTSNPSRSGKVFAPGSFANSPCPMAPRQGHQESMMRRTIDKTCGPQSGKKRPQALPIVLLFINTCQRRRRSDRAGKDDNPRYRTALAEKLVLSDTIDRNGRWRARQIAIQERSRRESKRSQICFQTLVEMWSVLSVKYTVGRTWQGSRLVETRKMDWEDPPAEQQRAMHLHPPETVSFLWSLSTIPCLKENMYIRQAHFECRGVVVWLLYYQDLSSLNKNDNQSRTLNCLQIASQDIQRSTKYVVSYGYFLICSTHQRNDLPKLLRVHDCQKLDFT